MYNIPPYKMAAVKQDSAPKGGYPEFRFERHLPRRGPSGVVLLLGGAAVMAVGLARVAKGNRQRRELRKEQLRARLALLPLLQAEHDRRMLKAQKAFEEDEAKVARLVKGFKPQREYHTDRWVAPSEEIMRNKH